mmetsp:Transcript_41767/g.50871  ORF Transcript_41767/g.50871 Transcript_41767/m.50871 type:complete len:189 (-) Transcript_41767:273-839(-)|eukprot:CAMPEP_0172508838 /NCGR_PEP_ID=MMETSP1066-20121228/215260_1 /TAXON_ID=671091 /ORGANISM="Coscinodiscus wailesii, Strain CCMP2513" /LENGTH=188 /DNA_ID=CAMNT_0013287029 /DNA_START=91 /DNA_END=657 /DNA_ORIENTATION=-
MTFNYIISFLYVTITSNMMLSSLASFVPAKSFVSRRYTGQLFERKSAEDIASLIPEEDLDRAVYCADHFGKCTPKELEHLKNELHTDRMKLYVDETAGVKSPLDFKDELGRRLLEEDLTLQLSLLNDEITLPMAGAVAIDEKKWYEGHNNQLEIQSFVNQGVMSFMIDSFVVCLAIAIVMVVPHLVHT